MKTTQVTRCFGGKEGLVSVLTASIGGDVLPRTIQRRRAKMRQAVEGWREYPPLVKQYQLEVLTNGRLRAQRRGPGRRPD